MAITRLDPTRTTTIRNQYMAEMRRRFFTVRSNTTKAIWKLDALGLNENEPFTFNEKLLTANQLPERQAWRFRTNSEKLTAFKEWFQHQIDQEILTVDVAGNPWSAQYVNSAYRKGAVSSFNNTHVEALTDSPDFFLGTRAQFIESAFTQPEMVSKIQFLYTRSFEELEGINAAMSQQVGRVLANGLAEGRGARAIAREMSNTITGIVNKRALVLARTEIIAAHAEGQLDALEMLGVKEVVADVEWSTAEDELVCRLCEDLEGAVFTIEQARGLIPRHPNCRCAWIPANVGERSKKAMGKAKAQTAGKVQRSLKSELPLMSDGVEVPQTIGEAKKRSTWPGKNL